MHTRFPDGFPWINTDSKGLMAPIEGLEGCQLHLGPFFIDFTTQQRVPKRSAL